MMDQAKAMGQGRLWVLACALVVASLVSLAAPGEAQAQRRSIKKAGTFEFGANFAGFISSTTTTDEDDNESDLDSSFLNPNIYFGMTVIPQLQVRLLTGYQAISNSRKDNGGPKVTLQDTGALSVAVQGLYYLPVEKRFSIYAGLGGGGYFGSTDREIVIDGNTLTATNDTNGGIFQLLFGALIEPNDRLTLRGGLRFDTLFGSESPDENNDSLQELSNTNVQLLLELSIGIRFGG